MSGMFYAQKDSEGHVQALSRNPAGHAEPGWVPVPDDAPEVLDFIDGLAGTDSVLRESDLSLVRVLEDVIDLLVERGLIRFTDLPLPAQNKLLQRRSRRKQRQGFQLLGDEDLI